jgi:putative peptidoglycan lipid II flippase
VGAILAAPPSRRLEVSPPKSSSDADARVLRISRSGRTIPAMAIGTLVSRITGLARLLVLAYVLGVSSLANAFNLANNTPNIIHDLVLGGVLSATFIPVFVHHLGQRSEAEASKSISSVLSLSALLLLVTTVAFVIAAPAIVDLYLIGSHGAVSPAERSVAVELLRYFAPQLACYGMIGLATTVLNSTGRFTLPTFVPIANNLIAIAVLASFAVVDHTRNLASLQHHGGLLLLLGIGTTLGVAVQALCLLPAMLRAGIIVRPVFSLKDAAVREVLQLSRWTLGVVVTNQIAVFVVQALAIRLANGALSAYTYAFIFFQLPFGTIAVSVMSAVTPDLARHFSQSNIPALRRRYAKGLRQMLAVIIPASVIELVLATPLITLLLRHGATTRAGAALTAAVLVLLALGLPSYCTYLLSVRAFQAMRDTRTTFWLYLAENGANVLLAILLVGPLGVRGLALALSLAYTLGAIGALSVLRRRLSGLGGHLVLPALARAIALSALMAVAIAVVETVAGSSEGVGLAVRVGAALVAGLAVYGAGALVATQLRIGRPRGAGSDRGIAGDRSENRQE